jgi:hypothetical protein
MTEAFRPTFQRFVALRLLFFAFIIADSAQGRSRSAEREFPTFHSTSCWTFFQPVKRTMGGILKGGRMPTKSEVVRFNLEYYRKQAKVLLKAGKAGDSEAL